VDFPPDGKGPYCGVLTLHIAQANATITDLGGGMYRITGNINTLGNFSHDFSAACSGSFAWSPSGVPDCTGTLTFTAM
jgi:hypothetical protein